MDHISFSQLNMYLRCGIQYYRRYIKGEILPPGAALVRGTCGHRALAKNYTQKIETLKDLPSDEVVQEFVDNWEKERYNIAWSPEELDGTTQSKAEGLWKDTGAAMTAEYQQIIAPNIFPELVEEKIEVEFEGGYPKLVAIIDRIDRTIANSGQQEKHILSEVKYVSKSPKATDIEEDVQMTAYDFAFRQKAKRKPFQLSKEFAVGTKTPKAITQSAPPRPQDQIDRFLSRLLRAMEGIQAGVFMPAANDSYWCSQKLCGYWATCPYRR